MVFRPDLTMIWLPQIPLLEWSLLIRPVFDVFRPVSRVGFLWCFDGDLMWFDIDSRYGYVLMWFGAVSMSFWYELISIHDLTMFWCDLELFWALMYVFCFSSGFGRGNARANTLHNSDLMNYRGDLMWFDGVSEAFWDVPRFGLHLSAFRLHLQPSTFNLQPSSFKLQASSFNLQPSK